MIAELILFGISVLPVILIIAFVYYKDKNKEPFELLAKLFIGGIGSCALVLILSPILGKIMPILSADSNYLNNFELIAYVFIGIAFVEEFCKWIVLYKISYNDIDFDEFYDMILYATFVALGFAFFENLFYVYSYGLFTGMTRAISSIPCHASCGILMGYYLGLSKIASVNGRKDLHRKNIIYSLLIPIIVHGIYDYCLFVNRIEFIVGLVIFMISVYVYAIRKIYI